MSLEQFLDRETRLAPGQVMYQSILYRKYVNRFAPEEEEEIPSRREFSAEVRDLYLEVKSFKKNGRWWFTGIAARRS